MNATEAMQPIIALREDVLKLPHEDYGSLDKYRRRAKLLITKALGRQSDYLNELDAIEFEAAGYYDPHAWDLGKVSFANLLSTILEDMELPDFAKAEAMPKELSSRVFVVHGHDNEMKLAVARALERLGLEPIILHEKPDEGKTIIEKFVHYSDVGFAIVLLSPDDFGFPKDAAPRDARPRARQNVILELGFFVGKLGRERVLALHKPITDFEMPSDLVGVLYKPYDKADTWHREMVRELQAIGYNVDANKLI